MMKMPALLFALLMLGANAEAPVADAAQRGDADVVRQLLRNGADVNAAQGDGMSALHWAAMNGRPDIVGVLLYAGANPESTTRLGGYTALHLASRAGQAGAIARLLEGKANAGAVTATGVTALHFAAAAGRPGAVDALVQYGAEVDAPTTADAQTPLMWATAFNRLETMKALLEAGADVSLTSAVVDYVAISSGDRPARRARQELVAARRNAEQAGVPDAEVEEAVDPSRLRAGPLEEEEEVPRPAEESATEEAEGAEEEAEARPAEESAAEEAKPAESSAEGEASGEEAAGEGAPEDEAEPEASPDEATQSAPDSTEAEGEPGIPPVVPVPAERALGYNDLVGMEGGFTALHFASRDGRVEAADLLLEYGAELDQPTAGDATTPLLMATINGNFDLAMNFLAAGADPNRVAEDGSAALFTVLNRRWGPKAAYPQPSAFQQQETDYLDLMTALMEAGADINHQTERHIWYTSFNFDQLGVGFSGATAFWRAAYATDLEAMRLLVAWGADATLPTRKVPSRRFRRGGGEDSSDLEPVPTGGPAVYPIHAASGVGYGEGFAANSHAHAPDSWLPAVQYLFEKHGADVNARDHNGYSPVHHAAARGDNELIEYLVSQGADVTYISRRGETTVDMANGPRQRVQPFPETIALLESLGAVNNDNCQSC
jgi:ankyrin repeat protein